MNFERPFECFMGDNYNLLVQKNTFITPHLHIRSDAITYPTHALPLSALSSANFKELYNLELDFLFNLERDQEFPGVGDSYPEILYTVGLKVRTGNGNGNGNSAGSQSLISPPSQPYQKRPEKNEENALNLL